MENFIFGAVSWKIYYFHKCFILIARSYIFYQFFICALQGFSKWYEFLYGHYVPTT